MDWADGAGSDYDGEAICVGCSSESSMQVKEDGSDLDGYLGSCSAIREDLFGGPRHNLPLGNLSSSQNQRWHSSDEC